MEAEGLGCAILTFFSSLFFFTFFSLSFVDAYLLLQEEFTKSFDVHSIGNAPVYQRDIFLKLTKDGTSYQDTYYFDKDNVEAMIGFTLPKDKKFMQFDIFDLSNGDKESYVPIRNIREINDCRGYYQLENINGSYAILLCPFSNDKEKIIRLEAFFYNDETCSLNIEKGLYFFTLKEFEIIPSRSNFYLRLSATVDGNLYYNRSAQNVTCGDNSKAHYLGSGFMCEGYLDLPANYSRYLDFTLGGQDKDIIAKQEFERQINEQWAMTNKQLKLVWIGIFISMLIALFPLEFRNLGKRIINLLNGEVVNLNEMSAEKELLKLEYENHRTYAFAEFAALLVIAFGVISNIGGMKGYVILIFTITFIAILIGFWASFMAMRKTFEKLRGILLEEEQKNKKETKNKSSAPVK